MISRMRILPTEPSALASFWEANGICRLSLFGSELHGTARSDSDIDLLVELEAERTPGLFKSFRDGDATL